MRAAFRLKFAKCCVVSLAVGGEGKSVTDSLNGNKLFTGRCAKLVKSAAHIAWNKLICRSVYKNNRYFAVSDATFCTAFFKIESAENSCTKLYEGVKNPNGKMQVTQYLFYDFLGGRVTAISKRAYNVFGNRLI